MPLFRAVTILLGICMPDRGPVRVVADGDQGFVCWRNGESLVKFLDYSDAPAAASPVERARIVSLVRLFAAPSEESISEPVTSVQLHVHSGQVDLAGCRVRGPMPATTVPEGSPRSVTHLNPAAEPYRGLATAALRKQAVTIERVFQIDLDGDGTPETILGGTYEAPPSPGAVAWYRGIEANVPSVLKNSFVAVHLARKGKLVILANQEDSPAAFGAPGAWISGISDVQGDGKLELVISYRGNHWARYEFVAFANSVPGKSTITEMAW